MRILFLNPGGSLGGAERCLLDLVASIRAESRREDMVLGLVAGGAGPLIAKAEALGVRVVRLPLSDRLAAVGDSALVTRSGAGAIGLFARRLASAGLDVPGYARELRAAVREFAPSVVHSNGIKTHLLAAAIRGREPLVWHIRDFVGERPLVSRAMRALANRASVAIAISNAVADDARRIMPNLRVSVVHDGIDTETFSPAGRAADLDALSGDRASPPGTVRVGLVATYARWKGHDVFLEAIKRLVPMSGMPSTRFYIVGGPIYETAASQYREDELRELVAQLGVGDRVRFVPFQKQIDEVFRALDVVVHASSRREPFGRTIAEAMATGKAVVASRESGAAELFADGVDAVATPARDPDALAEAIRGLVVDPSRREAIGEAARATAVQRFSRERLAKQIFSAYRDAGCVAFP
jgi:glycosyltransferase involved in cell wall biosynthesis